MRIGYDREEEAVTNKNKWTQIKITECGKKAGSKLVENNSP